MKSYKNVHIICRDKSDESILQFSRTIVREYSKNLKIDQYDSISKENLPEDKSILILQINNELLDEVKQFYKLMHYKSDYVLLLLCDSIKDRVLEKIDEIKHLNSLFPPFSKEITDYVINSSVSRFLVEKHYETKMRSFIREHNENQNKLRELDSIFKIYRLANKEKNLETLFKNALPIIAEAFNSVSKISIQITFMGKEYKTENFRTSSREFSDSLVNDNDFQGDLIMYINDENLEKFPITIEELNTFSTIKGLLSKAVQGIIYEKMKVFNFEYSMTIINLFRSFTNDQYANSRELFNEAISKMDELFKPDLACIMHYSENNDSYEFYSTNWILKEDEIEISDLIVKNFKNKDLRGNNQARTIKVDSTTYSIIPFVQNNIIGGFIIMSFKGERELTKYFQYSLFNMVSEYLSLAISSLRNLASIRIYKQAIEQSPLSIVITDLNGKIEYVNPHFEKVTGYELASIKGKNPRVLKSGEQGFEFYKKMWDTISSGEQWHGEFQNRCKDGSIIWESASISSIKDNYGKMLSYIAIKEDITKKVIDDQNIKNMNNKLISTQTTLVKEEKLASIGRLAAGVAHELNNPIGFINSNFKSLKRYLEKFKELFDHQNFVLSSELKQLYQTDFIFEDIFDILEESDDGFKRIINIINSLRSFSRIDETKTASSMNLNELIKTTLTIARNELKYNANIHLNYGDIPAVLCIAGEINQVLLNLIINASQAILNEGSKKLGNIYITTTCNDKFVKCSILDDGPGISDEDKLKIFDPFYTTKPIGQGTGLGLSISYDIIVNKHSGALYIGDNEERGAEFIIELPIREHEDG